MNSFHLSNSPELQELLEHLASAAAEIDSITYRIAEMACGAQAPNMVHNIITKQRAISKAVRDIGANCNHMY